MNYPYITLAQTIANNGDRHVARALLWLAVGRMNFAIGSMRKAAKNYKTAADLSPL